MRSRPPRQASQLATRKQIEPNASGRQISVPSEDASSARAVLRLKNSVPASWIAEARSRPATSCSAAAAVNSSEPTKNTAASALAPTRCTKPGNGPTAKHSEPPANSRPIARFSAAPSAGTPAPDVADDQRDHRDQVDLADERLEDDERVAHPAARGQITVAHGRQRHEAEVLEHRGRYRRALGEERLVDPVQRGVDEREEHPEEQVEAQHAHDRLARYALVAAEVAYRADGDRGRRERDEQRLDEARRERGDVADRGLGDRQHERGDGGGG